MSLSPHLDDNCIGRIRLMWLFWILESTEDLQLPCEDWEDWLWLILINFSTLMSSSYLSLFPSPVLGNCASVLWAAYTQLVGARWVKRSSLQIFGMYSMITHFCFWSQKVQTKRQTATIVSPSLSFWSNIKSRVFKEPASSPNSSFFSLLPSGARH